MCNPLDPLCVVGGAAGAVADNAFTQIIKNTLESVTDMLAAISTMWFEVPDPQVGDPSSLGTPSESVAWLQTNLGGLVLVIGMVSLMLAIARTLWHNSAREFLGAGRMVLALLASTGLAVGTVTVLLDAGDVFARWVVQEAAGAQPSDEAIVALWPLVSDPTMTLWLVLGLLALLGSIMQVAFMVVRGAAIIVLMGLLPLVAANSATPEGNQQLRRVIGLLAGFVLYKPIAGIIYAVGIRLMHGIEGDIMSAIYGLVIIILAALALPAMIKFFMPAAAAGSSNLFSGGTAATVAAGAAMVAVTGGAALAAGGATAAGGTATGASVAGGSGGAAGLGQGAAAPPPQGGGAGSPAPASAGIPSGAGATDSGTSSHPSTAAGGQPTQTQPGAGGQQPAASSAQSSSPPPAASGTSASASSAGGRQSPPPPPATAGTTGGAPAAGAPASSQGAAQSPRRGLGDIGSQMVARGSSGIDPEEPEGGQ